ncbi:thermonuclease family protein [Neisseria weaveri]|uniref:thermonuclease family protein n=1 Tax=Neisseria weaveri TaxID=28091 RepID=UPI0007C9A3CD|nr:thermonuclease family protein [Neisseria weaveri]SAY51272.1 nuclease [Neisseria weaveri]
MKKRILTVLPIALLPAFSAAEKPEWLEIGSYIAEQVAEYVWEQYTGERPPTAEQAVQYSGKVVAVHDGDTVQIRDGNGRKHKVRLAYVDAPELQQKYGTESRNVLRSAVQGKTVDVTVYEKDRYQREVARIVLRGYDVNLAMIKKGHAWHYVSIAKKKQGKAVFAEYAYAESQARAKKLGLWKSHAPEAPWDYRRKMRGQQHDTSGGRPKETGWFEGWW